MTGFELYRIFRKHTWLLITVLLMIALSKAVCLYVQSRETYSPYLSEQAHEYFNLLLDDSKDMTLDERLAFINEKTQSADTPYKLEAVGRYSSLLRGCYRSKGITDYARSGRGLTDQLVPDDLLTEREAYASLETPTVIDTDAFIKLMRLLAYDISPVWIMLLVGSLNADGYEKGIDRQISISKNRRRYHITHFTSQLVIILTLYTLSFAADMMISGSFQSGYMTAPFASTGHIIHMNATVAQVIFMLFLRGLICCVICFGVFIIAAAMVRSVRRYIVVSAGVIFSMTAAAVYITRYSVFFFAALCDKEKMLMFL